MSDLFIIPARGGSKGVPGKNIKFLGDRPLIYYTLDAACQLSQPENICVSTDSDEIIEVVKKYGLDVAFKRPAELASDTAGSYEVITHALNHYEKNGRKFDRVILLQPTSPFRRKEHISEALLLFSSHLDMVASVKESKANPYFNLFEESNSGYLTHSKKMVFVRRQDCPAVYEYNGAIYVINANSLKKNSLSQFKRVKKYVMTEEDSLDIDTQLDFLVAQALIEKRQEEKKND